MSTDYDAVCLTCRLTCHLGQRFAGRQDVVFGYGLTDEEGRSDVGRFLLVHLEKDHDVRLVESQTVGMDEDSRPMVVLEAASIPEDIRPIALVWHQEAAKKVIATEQQYLSANTPRGYAVAEVKAFRLPGPQFKHVEYNGNTGEWVWWSDDAGGYIPAVSK